MTDRNCVVLAQYRDQQEYNDFVGTFYHFPKKYLRLLTEPNIEFVYYEPTKKDGKGVYFGYGRLGRVLEDKQVPDHYFAGIIEYKPFAKDVPFEDDSGAHRESGPTFNAQNAARRVSPEALDTICLDGGIMLNFHADAHLIKVLGEELIASEAVGILELIKNAYDANATRCKVRIEKIPGFLPSDKSLNLFNEYDGPVILVEDNGTGMDRYAIEYGWMRPASILKTSTKERLKQERHKAIESGNLAVYESLVLQLKELHGGRLPLGEKGVGRFAAHRLGSKTIIKTKTANIDYEYVLAIDWDKFEIIANQRPVDLDSIGFSLTRQKPSRDYGSTNSGTQIIIYGGKPDYSLTDPTIREINRSILLLQSPKNSPDNFKVIFECPQIMGLDEKPIIEEYEPSWSLDALVDNDGYADLTLSFRPPKSVPLPPEIIERKKYDLRKTDDDNPSFWLFKNNELRTSACGPFFLHIDIWYRKTPWISGMNVRQFTGYLDRFGGISIFRDGMNIFPAEWGATVDWLNLNKRHIKKGQNLSYYNLVGNLEVQQDVNIDLIDKTDRQGLVNNAAFEDLVVLTRNLILFVELQFIAKREAYEKLSADIEREPQKLRETSRQSEKLVGTILERYDIIRDTSAILENFGPPEHRKENLLNLKSSLKNMEKSLKAIQEVQEMLSEQAGYGLAIGVAVHEITKITSNFYRGVTEIIAKGTFNKTQMESLKSSALTLKSECNKLAPLRAIRNESPTVFDVTKAVRFCRDVFQRKLEKNKIDFEIVCESGFTVYARYGALNQILSNLIDNSCYWLANPKIKNRRIAVRIDAQNREIIFADNGPDVDESIRPYLFQPGYSLKVPPSGLGLYICKYYMQSMKGDIYEARTKDRIPDLPGAQFILDFSRIPERGE